MSNLHDYNLYMLAQEQMEEEDEQEYRFRVKQVRIVTYEVIAKAEKGLTDGELLYRLDNGDLDVISQEIVETESYR